MDYFTLFGLPARYQLDTQALSLVFRIYNVSIILINSPAEARRNNSPPYSNLQPLTRPGKRCVIR